MTLIISIVIGLIIAATYIACAARMNESADRPADNSGSETGVEQDRDLKYWEGWK